MGKNNVKRKVVPMDSVENAATSPLDEIVRRGAREMLQTALEAEVYAFIANYEDDRDEQGHRLVVRNGHLLAAPVRMRSSSAHRSCQSTSDARRTSMN